jgi:hypothetical protein
MRVQCYSSGHGIRPAALDVTAITTGDQANVPTPVDETVSVPSWKAGLIQSLSMGLAEDSAWPSPAGP